MTDAELEAELAAMMEQEDDDDDEMEDVGIKKGNAKKDKHKNKIKNPLDFFQPDEDSEENSEMEDELAQLMAQEDSDDNNIQISDDSSNSEDENETNNDQDDGDSDNANDQNKEEIKPSKQPEIPPKQPIQPPPAYMDIPDLTLELNPIAKPQQPAQPAVPQPPKEQPKPTPQQPVQPQKPQQQQKNAQQIEQARKAKLLQQKKKQAELEKKKRLQEKVEAQKKAAAAAKAAEKQAPKPLINETSNPEYDKIFSTFASSFYSFILNAGKPEGDSMRKQVDNMLPIVVAGPKGPQQPLKVHQPPQTAVDTSSFNEFRMKPVISNEEASNGQKILTDLQNELKSLTTDLVKLSKLKQDPRLLKSLIESKKKLQQTIDIYPDYPYLITQEIKYALPAVNTDLQPNIVEIQIGEVKNLPKGDHISIRGGLPLVDILNQNIKFATPPIQGQNTNVNFRKTFEYDMTPPSGADMAMPQIQLTTSSKRHPPKSPQQANPKVMLLKTNPAYIGIYNKQAEIDSANFPMGALFTKNTISTELKFAKFPNCTVQITIRIRNSFSGKELKIITRQLKLSPIVAFAPPKKAAAPKQQQQQAPTPAKAGAKTPNAPTASQQAAAKAKLRRKNTEFKLPPYYILSEEELKKFWSINCLQYFIDSSKLVLMEYSRQKQPPPTGLEQMNRIATSHSESIQLDVQEGRLSMEDYVAKVQAAIQREKDHLNDYMPGLPRESANARIGIMVKELEDFQ